MSDVFGLRKRRIYRPRVLKGTKNGLVPRLLGGGIDDEDNDTAVVGDGSENVVSAVCLFMGLVDAANASNKSCSPAFISSSVSKTVDMTCVFADDNNDDVDVDDDDMTPNADM